MAGDGRKSLMISKEAHAHLMSLADTFKVSQPELVEALIKSADKVRLQASLTELMRARELAAEDAAKKETLLKTVLKDIPASELEKILKSAGKL